MNIDRRKLMLGTAAVAGAAVVGIEVAEAAPKWSVRFTQGEVVRLPEGFEIASADGSRLLGWIAVAEPGLPLRFEPVTEAQARSGFLVKEDGSRVEIGDNDWGRMIWTSDQVAADLASRS